MTIEQLKVKVAAYLPPGWKSCECFLLALNGRSSPEMVTAYRETGDYKATLAKTPKEERAAYKTRWYQEYREQMNTLEQTLKAAGLNVKRDGLSIYILN